MKINSIDMSNYRNFSELHIDFDSKLTVFVGSNGSGKTTILDALAIPLEMIANSKFKYLHSDSIISHDSLIPINDIRIQNAIDSSKVNEACLNYNINYGNKNFSYSVYTPLLPREKSFFKQIEYMNNYIKDNIKPVVVYYSSKRIINDYTRKPDSHSEYDYAFKNAFQVGIDFSSSMTWFIEKSSEEALNIKRTKDLDYSISELDATRKAISKALGDYKEPYVDKTPPQIFIAHASAPDVPLSIQQLSDGYRTMLALVMDLARRMALAAEKHKQEFTEALEYPAIVLIDEVELHLHPAWQQRVLPTLLEIFPNTQFIVTTHSPQIISSIKPEHLRILAQNNVYTSSSSTYGAESQRILKEVFGVNARYAENEAKIVLDEYFELINKGEYDTDRAKECRGKLDEWLRGDPALDSADMLIRRSRRIRERSASNA